MGKIVLVALSIGALLFVGCESGSEGHTHVISSSLPAQSFTLEDHEGYTIYWSGSAIPSSSVKSVSGQVIDPNHCYDVVRKGVADVTVSAKD